MSQKDEGTGAFAAFTSGLILVCVLGFKVYQWFLVIEKAIETFLHNLGIAIVITGVATLVFGLIWEGIKCVRNWVQAVSKKLADHHKLLEEYKKDLDALEKVVDEANDSIESLQEITRELCKFTGYDKAKEEERKIIEAKAAMELKMEMAQLSKNSEDEKVSELFDCEPAGSDLDEEGDEG